MGESPVTRPSLLLRIRDRANDEAWRQFVALYAPLVYQFGKRRGLQDADAADLTQLVFGEVSRAIERLNYDPQRGTFRGWLLTVTRNQLTKLIRARRTPAGGAMGGDVVNDLVAEVDDQGIWDEEYHRRLFCWASEQVRPEFEDGTWRAFWRTAVDNLSAKDVGVELGMSVGAIYTARSRVLRRLKDFIQELDDGEQPVFRE